MRTPYVWGSPAEEELLDTLSFDDWLQPNKESSFLIKVSSSAMIDAGIHPEDVAIIERGRQPKDGDIILAQVDEQWVMRYYQHNNGQPYLLPANREHDALIPQGILQVIGVVVACIRKYH